MSQSATPATQNDMTTCLETFEKERVCSFPNRHGINDATPARRRRCTTKLAQSTSQYYFVLESLHKALPSTTSYYTACTKHFPILLCTAKLVYCKACTKHFPVLLCIRELAQSTSQYYFVLHSLHKALPYTTLYCKACVLQSLHKALPSTALY